MTTTESPIDSRTTEIDATTTFITDASLLIRPAVPGQYPASAAHDTAHVYRIFELGNTTSNYPAWHIFCPEGPDAAHELLDGVFNAYVDIACGSLWCDARVLYIVDGEVGKLNEYGFDDGQYTMVFNVYCNMAGSQAEELLARLTSQQESNYIVVRPDTSNDDGVSASLFTVGTSDIEHGDAPDLPFDPTDGTVN